MDLTGFREPPRELTTVPKPGSFLDSIRTSLKTQTATWFVGVVFALLGLFSTRMVESARFALNRADLRSQQYEELATQVSQYMSAAEWCTEFLRNGWTTKDAMAGRITDYNNTLKALYAKKYVHRVWIQRYWDDDDSENFASFLASIEEFDAGLHALNDDFTRLHEGEIKRIEPSRAEDALKVLHPAMESLRLSGSTFLESLEPTKL